MKLKSALYTASAAIAMAAMLASCSGNNNDKGESRTLADYKDLSAGDSVAFYLGQLSALDYWQMTRQDTIMASQESRDQFLKGLRAGYDAVRDNDAYNRGYYTGVQMAMQMKEFNSEYETTSNKSVLFDAISDGLRNDSAVNPSDAQMGFSQITEQLGARKEQKDRETAKGLLQAEAKAKGWTKITDDLYASPAQGAGDGAQIKDGDNISISFNVSTLDGKEIDRRENLDLVVGKMYVGPITQAVKTMKIGQIRTFYASASALLGRMYARYGLKATDLVQFTISAKPAQPKAVTDESEE